MSQLSTHLKAKVVAYTQSTDDTIKDANELIAYIARVSNPNNQHNNLTAPKLINYLIDQKHWSPFEHYHLTIEIECPKDIGIQFLRHRSLAPQEFSQRYADVRAMGFTLRECRLQDVKDRQNSLVNFDEELAKQWADKQQAVLDLTSDVYKWAIDNHIAKEQAALLYKQHGKLLRDSVRGKLQGTGNTPADWLKIEAKVNPERFIEMVERIIKESDCEGRI